MRDRALERRVTLADKSMVVYLRNESPFDLKMENLHRTLEKGRAFQLPVSKLPSSRQAVWGTETYESWDDQTYMGEGIFGEVAYRCENTSMRVYLQWAYPRGHAKAQYKAKIIDTSASQTEPLKYKIIKLKKKEGPHSWIIYSLQPAH